MRKIIDSLKDKLGKKQAAPAPLSALTCVPAKKAKSAPKGDGYKLGYDRLRYAVKHGKITEAKYKKEIKALRAQFGKD